MDDNINGFYRFNKNLKVPVGDGAIFAAMEDFSDRYVNVPLEATSQEAWKGMPSFWRNVVLGNPVT